MPKLVSIAGPLCGGVFHLLADEGSAYSVGRALNNTLCIEDPSVSRHHCVLTRHGGQVVITDRKSVNRTFINGLPLEEHTLRNGDEIKIGESLFVFVLEGDADVERDEPLLEKRIHVDRTQIVRAQDALRLVASAETLPPPTPGGRYFQAVLSMGEAIPSSRGLEDLERDLMESLCRAFPAERGMLVLAGDSTADTPFVYEWKNVQDRENPVLPPVLLDKVVRDPTPLLWNRFPKLPAETVASPEFLVAPYICSIMAVPLVAFERLVGALCLMSSHSREPFDDQHLRLLVKMAGIVAGLFSNAINARALESEARQRRAEINLEHNMVGESPQMRKIYDTLAKVAPTDSTVLIRGESGTGKELAAHAIHRNSRRSRKAFIAINCAALAETLLESELFGHEKGAFTGAVAQKKGKLEEAIGGTIFFDEVTEMSPILQAKLLRVIQEREFERVGGTRSIKADVRIIAATNRDLEEAIRSGSFRSDLYFRLNVISLIIPPLRERPDDIEQLANHFAQKHSRKLKRHISGISRHAYANLRSYDWPGNVRELENVIERALVLGATDMIQPEDLPDSVIESNHSPGASATSFHATIKDAKMRLITETLQKTNGNYSEAAKLLELHPNSLHRIIRNLNSKVKSAG